MDPQANTPLGQPVNADPTGTPVVPQPIQPADEPKKPPSKRLIITVLCAVAGLLVLAGALWWMAQTAKKEYVVAAAAYKTEVKTARDAMNKDLEEQNIGGSNIEAKPLFEEHGKKIQAVIAKAPEGPKVLGIIPVGSDKEVTELSKAASNYANALRTDFAIFNYYTEVTRGFKPIKEIGTIRVTTPDKVKAFGEQWPIFAKFLKSVKPPSPLQSMHSDLNEQANEIERKTVSLVKNFDSNSQTTNDKLLGELNPLTTKLNKMFTETVQKEAAKSYQTVNATYDRLDEQLK